MSKLHAAAVPTRRKDNRFDPADFADVLAPKGHAAGAVTAAEQRGTPLAVAAGAPQLRAATEGASSASSVPRVPTSSEAAAQQRRRNSTSFDFPDYVNEGITAWLRGHPEHNLKTMIHLALTKLGVHVEPEDLVPQRRRRR
jgi:hypothetical protein